MASSIQFWGLGSGLSNTAEIIDAMLVSQTQKLTTYDSKIDTANIKKSAWNDIQSSVKGLDTFITKFSGVGNSNFKAAKISDEGAFSATVDKNAIDMNYSINITKMASKHSISGRKVDSINEPLILAGEFDINGSTINITEEDTLSSIMSKINEFRKDDGSKIGAKAYIVDGTLILESEETGKSNEIKLNDTTGILKNLGLIREDGTLNTIKSPENSIVEINGITVERDSNNITDAIPGVTLNLTKITSGNIDLKIGNDTSDLKNTITEFVNNYNSVLTKLDKYRAYDSDSGASGILNGDSSISTIKTALSSAMQTSFEGENFSYLFDIGISVDKYGKYQIDDKKLNEALNKNPEDVKNMFTKGLDNPLSTSTKENGLFVKMRNSMKSLIGGTENLFTGKLSTLDTQIKNYKDLIARTNTYIEKRRATLEAQFSALETAMSSINNTSSMLSQMETSNKKDD